MRDLREVRLEAFHNELLKEGSQWYKPLVNFAKRQGHALTGYTPHGFLNTEAGKGAKWIEEIGAGAADARKTHVNASSAAGKERALKSIAANEKSQEMGLTSIPGYVRSLWKDPKATLQAGFNQQWDGTTLGQQTLMVGAPLAITAASAAMPDDPNNPHKGRDIGSGIANTAASMVTGGIPLTTGMLLGEGVSRVGGAVGGVVDKIRKRRRPPPLGTIQAPPAPEEARGQHVPTERVVSPAAAGQMPEGIS